MIKRSAILLTAVIAIYESDFPERRYYTVPTYSYSSNYVGGTGSSNYLYGGGQSSNNMTFISNTNMVKTTTSTALLAQPAIISASRNVFELNDFTNTLNNAIKYVQINAFGDKYLHSYSGKLDHLIYDYASMQVASTVISAAIFQKNYKINNLNAQIAKDQHASWWNIVAYVRNGINESFVDSWEEDITRLKALSTSIESSYLKNTNF